MTDEELFAKLSEIADEEIMARNPKSIIAVGREIERRTLERAVEVCHGIGRDGHISMLPGAPRCAYAIRALMEPKDA